MKKTAKKQSPRAEKPAAPLPKVDAQAFAENMAKASDLWQRVVQAMASGSMAKPPTVGHTDTISLIPMSSSSRIIASGSGK